MRHLKLRGKLNRTSAHRKALFRNLLSALLKNGSIQTTVAKAKQLRRFAEPIVEMGKTATWQAKRMVRETVNDKEAMNNLFTVYGPRFKDRHGGYTRIFRTGYRPGDGAEMSIIEILPDSSKENEPRIIKIKHRHEEEEGSQKSTQKKGRNADNEKRREGLKLKAEAKRTSKEQDIDHSHTSQRRKTEKGTGRSKSTKKGLS